MDSVVAVVGTLAGTLLGATATHFTQTSVFKRESRERETQLRRSVYVTWLTECQRLLRATERALEATQHGSTSQVDSLRQVRSVSAEAAQAALENVRLVADQHVAGAAARMWRHLRRPAHAAELRTLDVAEWAEGFWAIRRGFIDEARAELRLATFDWHVVSGI
jgi:hypothetical protein